MPKQYDTWKPTQKWTMKSAMEVKLPELMKMSLGERADLAQFFQSAFKRRYNEAVKAESMPYGVQKIIDDMEIVREMYGVSLMNRVVSGTRDRRLTAKWKKVPYAANVLTAYISSLQDFFTWKSNSVAGWNKIKSKESGDLFGWKWEKQVNGRRKKVPIYQMNDDERRQFWKVYHELIKRESNTLVQSDPGMRTNYFNIKESGLNRYWAELMTQTDVTQMSKVRLIEIMEASMDAGELTFPEHVMTEYDDDGNEVFDPFADSADAASSNDFWGRDIDENYHLIK